MKAVVTLTTIPTRIVQDYDHGIKACINSLLNQTYDDYEIHFNVPYIFKYTGESLDIPEWFENLAAENTKFKIFRCQDLGPVTKLVHTVARIEDGNTIIIVCDDDLIYHPEMVSEHVKNQETYQLTACGYDGVRSENPSFGDIRDHYVVSIPYDVEVNHLQHYKTVSYKREWFKLEFFTNFVGSCWNDDILVAAYMASIGVKRIVRTYDGEEKITTKERWDEIGGVTTFPVIAHTAHEGQEGCNLYRNEKSLEVDKAYELFRNLGYLK